LKEDEVQGINAAHAIKLNVTANQLAVNVLKHCKEGESSSTDVIIDSEEDVRNQLEFKRKLAIANERILKQNYVTIS